jgi:ribose transport system permease protein
MPEAATIPTPAEPADDQSTGRRRTPRLGLYAYRYAIVIAWIAVIAVFGALRPDTFLTAGNFQTIFGSQAVLLILTLGLLFPLAAGEFDLSVGGTLGFAAMITAVLNVNEGVPVVYAALVALAAGLVIGAVNAFFIVKVGVHSFVVTLGTGTLLVGLTYGISNSTTVGGISQSLVDAMRTDGPLGLPLMFYYALALTIVCWYLFSRTPLGRYLLFIGLGRDVARLAGIRVDALRVLTLLIAALIAAFAGVCLAGSLSAADPTVGNSYLLPAFAGAFLGSTAVQPDRFNPWGAFLAVYFLVTGITGLQLLGYSGWVEQVFYGSSLVIAVTVSRLVSMRSRATA